MSNKVIPDPRILPSCVQEASKLRPRGPRGDQQAQKASQERSKSGQERPQSTQERPKSRQERPEDAASVHARAQQEGEARRGGSEGALGRGDQAVRDVHRAHRQPARPRVPGKVEAHREDLGGSPPQVQVWRSLTRASSWRFCERRRARIPERSITRLSDSPRTIHLELLRLRKTPACPWAAQLLRVVELQY